MGATSPVIRATLYDDCRACGVILGLEVATFEVSGHFSFAYAMPEDHRPDDHYRETTGGGEDAGD